jgi:hypothetical protein
MSGHIGDNDLLCGVVPKVVDAQATPWITRIAASLNMPIRYMWLTLPQNSEFVGAAR